MNYKFINSKEVNWVEFGVLFVTFDTTMETDPLRQDAESPPPSLGFKESERKASPTFLNKRTIIILGIVILVLFIVVIVLGALLGAERAKNKGESK